jgi:hypothetical protein
MSKLKFNTEPYFDDYDITKGYHKVMFKPGGSVQTRELNQVQSMVANQIEQFGNHIFKHGSIVSSSVPKYNNSVHYVRLKDDSVIDKFQPGSKLFGNTTGITAVVVAVEPRVKLGEDLYDPATLFVTYENSGSYVNSLGEVVENKVFLDGEKIILMTQTTSGNWIETGDSVEVRCPTCPEFPNDETTKPTGKSSIFTVTEGIYYIFGYFVYTPTQVIILEKYSNRPTYDVGFKIHQNLITTNDDESLFDNALGYPNYTAPGADRYQIKLELIKREYDSATEEDDDWVLISKIKFGVLSEIKDKPQYADIEDMIARRTFDESGNYTVTPFLSSYKEFMKSSPDANDGYVYPDETTDQATIDSWKSKFAVLFTPGKAYIKGREIEKISESIVEMDKARDTDGTTSAIRTKYGNYIYVALHADSNIVPLKTSDDTSIYPTDFERLQLIDENFVEIGTCRVKSQEIAPSTIHSVATNVYKLYLFDIQMSGTNTFSQVREIQHGGAFGSNQKFRALVLSEEMMLESDPYSATYTGSPRIYEPENSTLIYKTPNTFVKGVSDVFLNVRMKSNGSLSTNGNSVTFYLPSGAIVSQPNYQRWLFGIYDGAVYKPYDIDSSLVTIPTSNSVTIDTSSFGFNSSVPAILILDVSLSKPAEISKEFDIKTLTISYTNDADSYDPVKLDITEAYKILSVTDVTDPLPENHVDITNQYTLKKNIFDSYYGVSEIVRTPGSVDDLGNRDIKIQVVYIKHKKSNELSCFYTVDSYSGLINDADYDYDYEDIPTHTALNGEVYELRSCFDFRPDMINSTSEDFAEPNLISINNDNIIFDSEYYLSRIDKIAMNKDGDFKVIKGVSALEPVPPKTPENMMGLYDIIMNAYTIDVKKDVKSKYYDNRRFTMRDIGKIEKRVDNLEEYVTLTMLENDTVNLEIPDAQGRNRFKNGLVVDNFSNFLSADTKNGEFKTSFDVAKEELRPSYLSKSIKLILDETASSNYRISSGLITQDYTEQLYKQQLLSSKTLSVNPYFIFNWVGEMELEPNMDNWKDVETDPELVVNVDTGMEDVVLVPGDVLGAVWDGWVLDPEQDGEQLPEAQVSDEVSLGTKVTDVNLIPWIRSQDIKFIASSMRPDTKIYAFFDNVDVTQYCRALDGGELKTNSDGELIGFFTIPNNDIVRFNVGDRIFKLTDSKDNSDDPDVVTTSSTAKFWAGGLKVNVQETKLNIEQPGAVLAENACIWDGVVYEEGTLLETFEHDKKWSPGSTAEVKVEESPFGKYYGARCKNGGWESFDPVAQSFKIELEGNGVFLTKLDVFFAKKAKIENVWCEIREMINGYPGPKVMKYSHVVIKPKDVIVDELGQTPTSFKFEAPVYLKGKTEYCFIIGSKDPEYRIHVARLGETDVNGGLITTQPTLGTLFKSQNNSTWTTEQYEDIKFVLYNAKFDRSPMNLVLHNDSFEKQKLRSNPFQTTQNSTFVRVFHKSHGLNVDDKVKIDVDVDVEFKISKSTGDLLVGQVLTNENELDSTLTVSSVRTVVEDDGTENYMVSFSDISGKFESTNTFTSSNIDSDKLIPRSDTLIRMGFDPTSIAVDVAKLKPSTGEIIETITKNVNGIPTSEFNATHTIRHVPNMDEYVIELTTNAQSSGIGGGDSCYAKGNIQVDGFMLNADFKLHDASFNWKLDGVGHETVGSDFTDYASISNIDFNENSMKYLDVPLKVANPLNEGLKLSSKPSLTITGIANPIASDTNVSPTVLLDSLDMVSITNRVEYNSKETYEDVSFNVDDWIEETDPVSGKEQAKYVVKKVLLTNPATTLKILMDVKKSENDEIDIYYRTLLSEDTKQLESVEWVKTEYDEDVTSEHEDDFREISITLGDEEYAQTPLQDFKEFSVKIVLKAKNTAKPPRCKNFRAIAVT